MEIQRKNTKIFLIIQILIFINKKVMDKGNKKVIDKGRELRKVLWDDAIEKIDLHDKLWSPSLDDEFVFAHRFLVNLCDNNKESLLHEIEIISIQENNKEIILEVRPLVSHFKTIENLDKQCSKLPKWLVKNKFNIKLTFLNCLFNTIETKSFEKCVLTEVVKPIYTYGTTDSVKNAKLAIYTLIFKK